MLKMKFKIIFINIFCLLLFNNCKIGTNIISYKIIKDYNNKANEKINEVYKKVEYINNILELNEYKIEELNNKIIYLEEKI
jgi:peptidoglycan hydrolase CwlO-like protein